MQPIFSLLYTSRRAHRVAGVVQHWLQQAKHPSQVEVILSIDEDYPEGLALFDKLPVKGVASQSPGTCVKGWNAAAAVATGKVLIAISDDFTAPLEWDTLLINLPRVPPEWWEQDFAVLVHDGLYGTICTLAIATKVRYDRMGYFYHPGFESMFCDNDFTSRAIMDERLLDARHLVFQHEHSDNGKRSTDAVDQRHSASSRYVCGELLYKLREHRGFPIDAGKRASRYLHGGERSDPLAYAVCIQAIKDDFCLRETCECLYAEGLRDFFFCIPDEYWDGHATPEEEKQQVRDVAAHIGTFPGVMVDVTEMPVAPFRPGTTTRIDVETRVRNTMLDYMHSRGYYHYIIADGDEIWRKGLMQRINQCVLNEQPSTITCLNVPVVGLPGFPIDGAKDKVTVYVRGDNRFRECRTPYANNGVLLEDYFLIHFSGTRRTYEEIVAKMRESGHFDDAAYDFEGFIEKTLPNVQIGMKDVHMWRGPNIWPLVRAWSPGEWADIPETLRQYVTHEVHTLPEATVHDEQEPEGFPVLS